MNRRAISLAAFIFALEAPIAARAQDLHTEEDKTLYAIGMLLGKTFAEFHLTPQELAVVQRGISDKVTGSKPELDLMQYQQRIQEFAKKRHDAAARAAAVSEPKKGRTGSGVSSSATAAVTRPSDTLAAATTAIDAFPSIPTGTQERCETHLYNGAKASLTCPFLPGVYLFDKAGTVHTLKVTAHVDSERECKSLLVKTVPSAKQTGTWGDWAGKTQGKPARRAAIRFQFVYYRAGDRRLVEEWDTGHSFGPKGRCSIAVCNSASGSDIFGRDFCARRD